MDGQVPDDAMSFPIALIMQTIGELTVANKALGMEVARLKAQIYASDIDKAVLDSGVRGN